MLYLLIFASSAVELAYQVLWMRRFTLAFGATSTAGAISLAAIFLGLGLGNAVGGAWASKSPRPLRLFACMEVGMALGAALLEPILGLYDRLAPGLYPTLVASPATFFALQASLCFVAAGLPAFFMGGLLPVAGQALTLPRGTSRPAGLRGLYAASLGGASLGTMLVPTVLLPHLGAAIGHAVLIGANLALALGAWRIGGARQADLTASPVPVGTRAQWPRAPSAGILSVAFVSGAATISLEVLWARMLSMIHENSAGSFAVVLSVFLLGLALGAGLARLLARPQRRANQLAGAAWLAAGVLTMVSPHLFEVATAGMAYLPGVSESGVATRGLLFVALAILLPGATLSGVLLPFLLERVAGRGSLTTGSALGRLLAANTAGAVLGPLVTAFMILPHLGLWWSLALLGAVLLSGGVAMTLGLFPGIASGTERSSRAAWTSPGIAIASVCLVLWLANPGDVPRARWNPKRGERLVGLVEGVHGTLAVIEDDRSRWITFNNHYTLGGTASTGDERQQAHLPLLLHPAPRTAAVLGMGSGITAGAALLHPLERLTVLEILPGAVIAARDYFAHANYNLVNDPRAEILVGDARAFIGKSGRKFDVIVGDLVTPWRPGESLLFSQEHFRAVKEALQPGGLYCQWLPSFQLTAAGFDIVAATFLDVFPNTTLWRGDFLPDQPALALIGTRDNDSRLDPQAVEARLLELAPRLDHTNPYLLDPEGLWLFLVGPLDPGDLRWRSARRNRDSRPWLEILTPLTQGSPGDEKHVPLVGYLLDRTLEAIRSHPLTGTWLGKLGPRELRDRDLGAALWRASLLAQEKNWEASERLARSALAQLPEKLQIAITGQVIKDFTEAPQAR